MTQYSDKLSAFLDGELSARETREIEAALQDDPVLQAELERLMEADDLAKMEFGAITGEPIPFELAQVVNAAPEPVPANETTEPPRRTGWHAIAAAMIALAVGGAVGGAGGYFTGLSQGDQVAASPGWLQDIADYHRVYAAQERHLVEVPASEAEHIQTWLTASVGADVRVPDLSEHGLDFQGARLLVASGKPVSQLMYLDAEGRVVALCQIQSPSPRDGFAQQSIGAFSLVSWGGSGSNFVVVGDQDRSDLDQIAASAAAQI